MTASLRRLNELTDHEAEERFRKCCGASAWARAMASGRPYDDPAALHAAADHALDALQPTDWLEAFAAHPRIGGRTAQRESDHAVEWSASEQSGMADADAELAARLAEANEQYLERFGFIFLICATGKSAAEMLGALQARLGNERDEELRIAAEQQRLITHLRLDKLLVA